MFYMISGLEEFTRLVGLIFALDLRAVRELNLKLSRTVQGGLHARSFIPPHLLYSVTIHLSWHASLVPQRERAGKRQIINRYRWHSCYSGVHLLSFRT